MRNNNFLLVFSLWMASKHEMKQTIIIMNTTIELITKWNENNISNDNIESLARAFPPTDLVHTCEWMKNKNTPKNVKWKKYEIGTNILPFELRQLVTDRFHSGYLNFKSYWLNLLLFDFEMDFFEQLFFPGAVKPDADCHMRH